MRSEGNMEGHHICLQDKTNNFVSLDFRTAAFQLSLFSKGKKALLETMEHFVCLFLRLTYNIST